VLRVGLTGGLGSGKSTAARLFEALGARVLYSDEMGRAMMQPGEAVYKAIVDRFGSGVVLADGALDRVALGRIAFAEGRVEELNAIVHPAVIARQVELIAEIGRREPGAVVMVESALLLETRHGGEDGWRKRFDKVVLVTAPEEVRVRRYVKRVDAGASGARLAELEGEARRRMAMQMSDERKSSLSDYVVVNAGSVKELEWQVDRLWPILAEAATRCGSGERIR